MGYSHEVGSTVYLRNDIGVVRYKGKTCFAPGEWIGVELEQEVGKNDGSVNGIRYFETTKKGSYGVFVRESMLRSSPMKDSLTRHDSTMNHVTFNILQKKLQDVSTERDQLSKQVHNLRTEVSELRGTIDEIEQRMEINVTENLYLNESEHRLRSELVQLKEEYAALKSSYISLEEEFELNQNIEKEISLQIKNSDLSNVDVEFVLKYCKQLESSILNLQSITKNQEAELSDQKKVIAEKHDAYTEGTMEAIKLRESLEASRVKIESFQEQIESMSDLNKIVENLTIENIELKDKILNLNKSVQDLKEIHEVDRTLEETQELIEKELREKLNEVESLVEFKQREVQALKDRNVYLEKEIESLDYDGTNVDSGTSKLSFLEKELEFYRDSEIQNGIRSNLLESRMNTLDLCLKDFSSVGTSYVNVFHVIITIKLLVSDLQVMQSYFETLCSVEEITLSSNFYSLSLELISSFKLLLLIFEYEYGSVAIGELLTRDHDSFKRIRNSIIEAINLCLSESPNESNLAIMESASIDLRSIIYDKSISTLNYEDILKAYFFFQHYYSFARQMNFFLRLVDRRIKEEFTHDIALNQIIQSCDKAKKQADNYCKHYSSMVDQLVKCFKESKNFNVSSSYTISSTTFTDIQHITDGILTECTKEQLLKSTIEGRASVFVVDEIKSHLDLVGLPIIDIVNSSSEKQWKSIYDTGLLEDKKSDDQIDEDNPHLTDMRNRLSVKESELSKIVSEYRMLEGLLKDFKSSSNKEIRDLNNKVEFLSRNMQDLELSKTLLLEDNQKLEHQLDELRAYSTDALYPIKYKNLNEAKYQITLANLEDKLKFTLGLVQFQNRKPNISYEWLRMPIRKHNIRPSNQSLNAVSSLTSMKNLARSISVVDLPLTEDFHVGRIWEQNYQFLKDAECIKKYENYYANI